MLLSADAKKAFDRVDRTFLKATLEHIGLGEEGMIMHSWISALYLVPSGSVGTNNAISEVFPVSNSNWQGCTP